eukprot:30058-Pelagococcus_subviridis.AAC.2
MMMSMLDRLKSCPRPGCRPGFRVQVHLLLGFCRALSRLLALPPLAHLLPVRQRLGFLHEEFAVANHQHAVRAVLLRALNALHASVTIVIEDDHRLREVQLAIERVLLVVRVLRPHEIHLRRVLLERVVIRRAAALVVALLPPQLALRPRHLVVIPWRYVHRRGRVHALRFAREVAVLASLRGHDLPDVEPAVVGSRDEVIDAV